MTDDPINCMVAIRFIVNETQCDIFSKGLGYDMAI